MKKVFFIFCLVFSQGQLFGQGNLQFNQVISTVVTATAGSSPELNGTSVGTITVPVGKVLKLESVSVYLNDASGDLEHFYSNGTANINDRGCWIGNHLVWAPYVYTSTGSTNFDKPVDISRFPIWFGPGTYNIVARFNTNFGPGTFYNVSYSAIEFNVL